MKKKNYTRSKKWITLCCMGLGLFIIVLVLCSMLYFRYKIREAVELVDAMEYKNYDRYYVLITDDRKNIFWQSVYEGAFEEAEESGVYVEMFGENLGEEYSKEDLMKIAIHSKVDGIIVEGDESAVMEEQLRRADEAGIPVVTALYDNPEGLRQSYVGVSSYNLGIEYGDQICEMIKRKPEGRYTVLVLLDKEKSDSNQNTLISAIRERIKTQGMEHRITVETAQVENNSTFAAEESIRDIFMQREVLPDVMVCLNERNTTCVYQTVVDYNKVGQIEIIGYYASETILSAIEKEIIYSTISINTEQMGKYCVEALNEYIQNGRVSDYYGVDVSLINADTFAASGEGGTDEKTD
ncbi:MAG: substrate-binding domain-containing protein [Lachnospiraceae bacterium]|nr:substrate-binding domain-containing protein [Lachnospiraceae bacterium]